uniref:neuronal regeneration-related protein isoform X1 n=1 Tax=Panthera onca TaxID=9690 RepID=UPI002954E839|nr:neuronal regeneration-related protein isoform X1 [Panthera onca]
MCSSRTVTPTGKAASGRVGDLFFSLSKMCRCREERVNRERGFCLFITQSSLSGSVKNHFQIRKWREGFLSLSENFCRCRVKPLVGKWVNKMILAML